MTAQTLPARSLVARPARHPVYRYPCFWGEVHEAGKVVFSVGTFRKRADAIEAARMWANQHTLPGIEIIGPNGEPARISDMPMRSGKAQKPCDIGLFSDDAAQVDLLDLLRAK